MYWAEDEPRDQDVPPWRRAVATAGFAVLRSWRTPPGLSPDGTVDAESLRAWVTEACRLASASGRPATGDCTIGMVLAYVPPGSDGLWPAEPVRDLIEDLQSPAFENGLRSGKLNSRGLVWSSPADGGVQERDFAAQFRAWAERVADGWHRRDQAVSEVVEYLITLPDEELHAALSRTTIRVDRKFGEEYEKWVTLILARTPRP